MSCIAAIWPGTVPCHAENFLHLQVDPVALELDDYFDVIKQPMDLGTIQKRLAPGPKQGWGTLHYKSTAEVLRDTQLVWANCRRYNDASDPIM